MSVNIYLVTEDLKQKEMNCAMYHKGQSEPYEVNIKEIKDENKHDDDFEELFNNLENICYYVRTNEMLKHDLEFEFYCLELVLESSEFNTDNALLKQWVENFKTKYNTSKQPVYFDMDCNEFVYLTVKKELKQVYCPAVYLPVMDDRIFNYGISNIQRMYCPGMEIGSIDSGLHTGECLVDNKKKEDIVSSEDLEQTITLNQFVDYLKEFVSLENPHEDDAEFFAIRQGNFKEQIKYLEPYLNGYGNKKIFTFVIA